MNSKGFTLIETLVVMMIVAVLAVIAIPTFFSYSSAAKEATVKADLDNVYYVAQDCYSDGVEEITVWGTLEDHGAKVSPGVVMLIVDGKENTLEILGWHADLPDKRYRLKSDGTVTLE